jgi:light-regulated signal transduction histidine kinase (bacteriophytochrome)
MMKTKQQHEGAVADAGLVSNQALQNLEATGFTRQQLDVLLEISERRVRELEQRVAELSARLDATNKELETFTYSVSHDLRAPLRHIEGYSALLIEDHGANLHPEARGYLERILAGAQRMGQLIKNMIELSRVARREMVLAAVNISDLAHAVAADLRKSEPNRSVEFLIAPNLMATGDLQLLRIALVHLLGNAWKYTSKHPTGRIELGSIAGAGGEVVYFVRDDGAGFDMEYAGQLFVAFRRLHSESEFEGTGIGLAIVQRIVQRHGGRIWAESAPEQGATFSFSIAAGDETPVVEARSSATEETAT